MIQKNVDLKNYTTYQIGGPAKYFFVAKDVESLIKAVNFAKNNKLKILIFGGGSNVLISDKGFNGLVIKIDIKGVKFDGNEICVGSGENITKLAKVCSEKGLSGLEWAAGIPKATIGGAIYGNAQAFGIKISDVIKSVEVINLKTGKIKNLSKEQCKFSLKNSIFKNPPAGEKNLIIISAVLKLEKITPEESAAKIKEFLSYRKNHHPINFPSAGSVFINPEKNGKIISAGYLIEQCGLKGKKIGGAQISEKHANFIINLGNAKAKDVLALIKIAKAKVKNKFKINLKTEIQIK